MKYMIAYDLGTGGTKASLFDQDGVSHASAFVSCETQFPDADFREQRPDDWWNSVVVSTRQMMESVSIDATEIVSLAVSGHSLGVVPVTKDGKLLADSVPIWSDARADQEAQIFFESVDENEWYLATGSGFPAPLYAIFKIMWYKNHLPQLYTDAACFIGTKDYINLRMTGLAATDHSYASGSGVYDLLKGCYQPCYIEAAGVHADKLPKIYPSTHILGRILPQTAELLGLSPETLVACGGVDNACMAVGAGCVGEGEAYTSLGTSAWIAVCSDKPIVNVKKRPYVFAHCIPGKYVSATSIFSAGNSMRWVRDTICSDLVQAEKMGAPDAYKEMDALAKESVAGAHRLIFNPSLAGGSGLDEFAGVRGGFIGLDLMHTRADLIRATLEGVCLNLRLAMDVLEEYVPLSDEMLLVGGGGKSRLWRELFAAIYNKNIVETNVGQDAGSLGAAAVAAVGAGIWENFEKVRQVHQVQNVIAPDLQLARTYEQLLPVFAQIARMQSTAGELISGLSI